MQMKTKTMKELYHCHQGKISDKWELYLSVYDERFLPYKNREVSVLEIGVQNGGSLEIYGKYFPKAKKIVGCDIDPACSSLSFEDPRIRVVVGDANTDKAEMDIANISNQFDLIIDDGSHNCGDVVKSFARYFSKLKEGGVYVVEDLCCSYWHEYEGGFYQPYSSMVFLKLLGDVINQEHWLSGGTKSSLLHGFFSVYDIDISDELLGAIRSVEFFNSLCIISKQAVKDNLLGKRIIVGQEESVMPKEELLKFSPPAQDENRWSMLENSLEGVSNDKGTSG